MKNSLSYFQPKKKTKSVHQVASSLLQPTCEAQHCSGILALAQPDLDLVVLPVLDTKCTVVR